MFYANINTKCFLITSNIFLCIFCVVFEFLILFVFFAEIFSLNHNGSFHSVVKFIGSP